MAIHEHYIEIYRNQGVPDGQGGRLDDWRRVDRIIGTATPRAGSLELDAGGKRQRRIWDVVCPYHPLLVAGDRLHYGQVVMRVNTADDPDGRRESLEIEAEELIP